MGRVSGHSPIVRVVFFALLVTLTSFAQQPKVLAPHKPIAPKAPKSLEHYEPGVPRSMVGGFWMIDANRKASIYLKNDLEVSSLTVTPSLYLSNGAKYKLDPVTLEESGTAVISVNEGLTKHGISSWATLSGYVEVEYTWAWDPLCISVTSVDPVHSMIFTTGFQPTVLTNSSRLMIKPRVEDMYAVDGMWWKAEAGVTGSVALSNTTAEAVDARVQASDNLGRALGNYAVHISPHGTKIVRLSALDNVLAGSVGGLRVLHGGSVEGLLINGWLEDPSSGYSANLAFHYSFTGRSQQTGPEVSAELGLMTGAADPMMRFPTGTTFTPFSVARNVSDQPVSVTPSVYWMQGGTARSARLEPLTLLPAEARNLDVPRLLTSAGLENFNGSVNLILEADGKPRALLLASGSVDQKNTYVFQVLPRGVQESSAKSISYWSTGNGNDTMVTVWNPADESQDYRFTLLFAGGHYRLPLHLEPRATRVFNISEIIQNQIPDEDGNIIPASVHEGSAKLTGSQADNEEILVALDAGTYNVRKATCSYYCISCDGELLVFVQVSPFSMPVGSTNQLSMIVQDNHGNQYSSSGTWTSTKTNVATVSGSGGLVTGVSPGTTTIYASGYGPIYNPYYCAYDPRCPDNSNFQGGGGGNVTPKITGIDPSSGPQGATVGATISGSGFGSSPRVTVDSDVLVSGTAVTPQGNINTVFTIGGSAVMGPHTVTVYNTTTGETGHCTPPNCPYATTTFSVLGPPTISGPSVVWWFNGNAVSGFPTQITLTTQTSGTWSVTAGASEIQLSAATGQSVVVRGTGTFSQTVNDISVTVTVYGVTSAPFSLTSNGPKFLSRQNKIDYPCSGNLQGWESDIKYKLRDNFNNVMASVPVNEVFSGSNTWPRITSTPGTTDSTGAFTDGIFVCAAPGGLNPMPISPQPGPPYTLVDSFSQAWCAGASVSNAWGATCQGASVQNGTMKRFLDHGNVTVP